jgi:malate permease and related proteins
MLTILLSILGVYLFIVVGYMAKRQFKQEMSERSITLLSIYFLQPFLVFWGLMQRPIDMSLVHTPLIYLGILLLVVIPTSLLAKKLFEDNQTRSIFSVAALVGNTGNLGIPIGIALFGEQSIPYTTMINLANVFFVYTVGVFYYSRGNFSLKDSLMNIVKLPILWFASIAIMANLMGLTLGSELNKILQMGAYTSIVLQLMLFGMYLYGVKIEQMNRRLMFTTFSVKFMLLPLVGGSVILLFEAVLSPMISGLLFMEILMPLAVTNVTLSALYQCRPAEVTALIFMTSLLFIPILFLAIELMRYLHWMS